MHAKFGDAVIGLHTNVLARYLSNDDPGQYAKAVAFHRHRN